MQLHRTKIARSVRHLLFAALTVCHAAVTLSGPCLHALPGSSHQIGLGSDEQTSNVPARSSTDAGDDCLICQFVAQGQLTANPTCEGSTPLVSEFVVADAAAESPLPHHVPSIPRAPPVNPPSLG
jgi:hypothetical protein